MAASDTSESDDGEILDVHSHFSTETAFVFQDEDASDTFGDDVEIRTEAEMVQDLERANVKAMMDFGFTAESSIDEAAEMHDYFADLYADHPERFLGLWVQIDPARGDAAIEEFERCLTDLEMGIVGFTINGSTVDLPADDERCEPFYDLCLEHDAPVHINVGYSGLGAGQRGGGGHLVEHCHPRAADRVAARYPDLDIIIGRPGWPWQGEAIATLLHKGNVVGNELHGWRPKYFPDELTYDIGRRLQHKVMFGGDYPLLDYETVRNDWEAMDLDDDVLAKVFRENARSILGKYGDL